MHGARDWVHSVWNKASCSLFCFAWRTTAFWLVSFDVNFLQVIGEGLCPLAANLFSFSCETQCRQCSPRERFLAPPQFSNIRSILLASSSTRLYQPPQRTMKIQFAPIFIAFLYHVLVANASLPCYTSNGTLAGSTILPCNSNLPTGSHSACCALGRTPPDACFSSGLCLTGTSIYSNGLIFANGCTDPTGKDPSCQQYCTGEFRLVYQLSQR